MAAVPVKPEYGPTLGRLLAPRWRAASRSARVALIVGGTLLAAVLVAAALALVNPTYGRGGRVPFHFSYRDLYRTTPGPGQFVAVQRLRADGRLRDSLAVGPLRLPAYSGEPSAELPVYTAGLIGGLRRRYQHFALRAEGKSTVNSVPAYNVYFSAREDGEAVYGRQVLLLPERRGARDGLSITLLTVPSSSTRSPLEVASIGVLAEALKSFTLG
jgi:hypothetical protein